VGLLYYAMFIDHVTAYESCASVENAF